jgi:hypothetical protein
VFAACVDGGGALRPDGKLRLVEVSPDRRRIPEASPMKIGTGVLLNLDLPAYLENILRLLPETNNIAVVVGARLGELSGAVTHEVNQPLTAIQSSAETGLDLLAEAAPDLDEVREVLRDIAHDNRCASEVVQRLIKLRSASAAIQAAELLGKYLGLWKDKGSADAPVIEVYWKDSPPETLPEPNAPGTLSQQPTSDVVPENLGIANLPAQRIDGTATDVKNQARRKWFE